MLELPPRFLAAFASLAHAPLGVRQEHGPSHCSRISGSDTVGCMRYWNTALLLALTCVLGSCSSGENTGSEAPAQTSPTPPANSNSAPSAVFVLGDSLSDVGNAAAAIDFFLNFPPYPPTVGLCNPKDVLNFGRSCDQLFYRQSRVSNGPVAVEYLAERLGVGELKPSIHFLTDRPVMGADYAVAGAKAREDRRGDLARQVGMLIFDHSERLPADALYVMMIGGNDAIDALQTAMNGSQDAQQASAAVVTAAVAAIGTNLELLLDKGARRLIVANVPDLAMLPAVRAKARTSADEADLLATASAITDAFNSELDKRLDEMSKSTRWHSSASPQIIRFDLRAAWDAADADAKAHGKDVVDACFDSTTYRHSDSADRVFNPGCAPAADGIPQFSKFAFWDDLHPTAAVHAAIGAALVEALHHNAGADGH